MIMTKKTANLPNYVAVILAVRDILDRAGLDSFKEPPHVRYYCGTYRVCFWGGRWYVTNGNQFVKFVKNKDRGIKYCAERCGWVL